MYCVSEFCYVCMNKANRVQCVKSTDTAYEELIHKLHSCQFLVNWSKINENYILICENCSVNLQIAYDFIKMCHKNSSQMQAYVNMLENGIDPDTNLSCPLSVILVDVKPDPDIDIEEGFVTVKNEDDTDFLGFSNEELRTSCIYSIEVNNKLEQENEVFQNLVNNTYNVKPFQCPICKKRFSRAFTLNRHKTIHYGVRYDCTVCCKQFTCQWYLDKHKMIHADCDNRKYYECTTCYKRFTTKSSLKAHYLIHKGKKPHLCHLCSKRFTYKSSLTRHMLVHNGFKSHMCPYCKKQFGLKSNLNVHMMIHNDIKPYSCSVCDKRFVQKVTLREHEAMHSTNGKLYTCPVCLKDFKTNASMKRHKVLHNDISFTCELCNVSFKHKDYLKRHLRIHL